MLGWSGQQEARVNCLLPLPGGGLPLVFCSVRGREESDGSESGEDTIVNRTEAEKVVRLSTISLASSIFCVKADIHASYPHGPVSTWHSTARSVVRYHPLCVTTCVCDPFSRWM